MKTLKLLALLTIALVSGVFVMRGLAQSAPAAPSDRSERAEVRFLEGMSDHHQMALDMAQDCVQKATTDDVRTLCQNIISAQSAEIKTMHDYLLNWYGIEYKTMPMSAMSAMMGMSATVEATDNGMQGMAMATPAVTASGAVSDPAGMMGMMAELNRAQGSEYEVIFLESMIDHHDDAIHMAERILKTAKHQEVIDLAHNIITDQTAEIAKMEGMLTARGD